MSFFIQSPAKYFVFLIIMTVQRNYLVRGLVGKMCRVDLQLLPSPCSIITT